jgi:hypothetical protein
MATTIATLESLASRAAKPARPALLPATSVADSKMNDLVPLRRLLNRLRHGAERAEELAELRDRYEKEPSAAEADPEDIALAKRLKSLRERLSDEFSRTTIHACTSCAKGHPLPYGRWPGGHCCGSRTDALFTNDELLAMKLANLGLDALVPPRAEHSGCAFRGPGGCSLEPSHRPNLCVAYTCRDLEHELRKQVDTAELLRLQAELRSTFARFTARQRTRREAELLGEP